MKEESHSWHGVTIGNDGPVIIVPAELFLPRDSKLVTRLEFSITCVLYCSLLLRYDWEFLMWASHVWRERSERGLPVRALRLFSFIFCYYVVAKEEHAHTHSPLFFLASHYFSIFWCHMWLARAVHSLPFPFCSLPGQNGCKNGFKKCRAQ